MHDNCLQIFREFAKTVPPDAFVADIGSLDVNGSLRGLFDEQRYVGVDICEGPNVDLVQPGAYTFPLDAEGVDVLVSANCAEHVQAVWQWVLEIDRVLRPGGIVGITAPWKIHLHRHPVHCWGIREDGWRYLFGDWMVANGRERYFIIECREIGMDSFIHAQKPYEHR